MSNTIDLVIFDCDGVLVDSEPISLKVDVEVLARLGWPLTEAEIIEWFLGVSDAYFRAEVEKALGRDLGDDWDAEFDAVYADAYRRDLKAVEGVVDALDRITCRTCVASSGTHEKMRLTLG